MEQNWNWQQEKWPIFEYDEKSLQKLESNFSHESGVVYGSHRHIAEDDKKSLLVELISDEAFKTSEIEGEMLDRDSLRASIRRNFGLEAGVKSVPPAEEGIADMMLDLFRNFKDPLDNDLLFKWHSMLTMGRRDLRELGSYRTHADAMQVVSGYVHKRKVHFEAPPSDSVPEEMRKFIKWFNDTAPDGERPLPALTRAGIAHIYFVTVHPFEDGNGRIGRAISEKALSQCLGRPTLITLSTEIERKRKLYYDMLERHNKTLDITRWLEFFSETILEAQRSSQKMIDFIIEKTAFYDRIGEINPRQEKVISRMFQEGVEGFKGGLSAANYLSITKTSRATATRDLQELVERKIFRKEGELKGTRYHLDMKR